MEKLLNRYFNAIKKNLPCYNKAMRKMLYDFEYSVCAYVYERDSVTFEEIEQHFGTPESIATEFAAGIDGAYIKSYRFKKRVTAIVVSILAVIMIAVSALVIYIITNSERNAPTNEGTTIIYEYKED